MSKGEANLRNQQFRNDVMNEPALVPLLYRSLGDEATLSSIYVHDWPLKEMLKHTMKNER